MLSASNAGSTAILYIYTQRMSASNAGTTAILYIHTLSASNAGTTAILYIYIDTHAVSQQCWHATYTIYIHVVSQQCWHDNFYSETKLSTSKTGTTMPTSKAKLSTSRIRNTFFALRVSAVVFQAYVPKLVMERDPHHPGRVCRYVWYINESWIDFWPHIIVFAIPMLIQKHKHNTSTYRQMAVENNIFFAFLFASKLHCWSLLYIYMIQSAWH
jgi:hypothetical protein